MAQRDKSIDFSRGVIMLIVILGHAFQITGKGTQTGQTVIQSFQMPFFMFLSGFCAFFSIPIKDTKVFMSKKIKGILVPYISWVTVLLMLSIFQHKFVSVEATLYTYVTSGFWFLRILFVLFLLLMVQQFLCGVIIKKMNGGVLLLGF